MAGELCFAPHVAGLAPARDLSTSVMSQARPPRELETRAPTSRHAA